MTDAHRHAWETVLTAMEANINIINETIKAYLMMSSQLKVLDEVMYEMARARVDLYSQDLVLALRMKRRVQEMLGIIQ